MKVYNSIKFAISANFSAMAKQVSAKLIASIFIISIFLAHWAMAYAATPEYQVEATPVKWHPGHYYMMDIWGKNNPKHLAQVYRELAATPALRGLQIRFTWAELEPKRGVYNFTAIDKRLAELTKQKKRLVILLQTKSFKPEHVLVPDYLKSERFEGGVFAFSSYKKKVQKGHNIKLWNPLVYNRLAALIRALGNRYNSHPYFEGIGLSESAMGNLMIALSSEQVEDEYYKNLLSLNQQMRKHFPNTMTFQFTNHRRRILESFVTQLKDIGTGLGGPDVFIKDPGLNMKNRPNIPDGIYSYYPKLSGIVPLTPSVMPGNYKNTRHDKTGYKPTVSELLSFARNQLKANYIFWQRDPEYYEDVLEILNGPNLISDPVGGLDPTCPSAYSSCVD